MPLISSNRIKWYWPFEFYNDTDIAEDANRIQHRTGRAENTTKNSGDKRRSKIIYSIETNENDERISEEINVYIDWGGQSITPFRSHPEQLLKTIAARLYIGSPNIGG